MKQNQIIKTSTCIVLAALLSACATKSDVLSDGTIRGEDPVFPDYKRVSSSFDKRKGTFPTADELAQVKAGMTKDQFYKLLGRPHFNEGMFNVREWDYVFHFHTPGKGTDNVTTCQFKIIYDKHKYARSFFWKAADPETAVCPPLGTGEEMQRYTISTDTLFDFDKAGMGDMNAAGRAQLDEFADKIKSFDRLKSIRITGHTDRLGSSAYNDRLSVKRAETVRRYLIERGVPAGVMSIAGLGKSQPVQECGGLLRNELIECLKPNRRVEIEVSGSGKL